MPIILDGTAGLTNNATDLNYTGTLTGGTGVVNLGSGQVVKDASGNVGIGTSSPQQLLAVGNPNDQIGAGISGAVSTVFFGTPSNNAGGIKRIAYDRATGGLNFIGGSVASPSTQMTLDSSGNLLVGTTSNNTNSRINVVPVVNTGGVGVQQAGAGDYCFKAFAVSNGGTFYYHFFSAGGTTVGSISSNTTTTSYGTSSDYRLKEAIAPMAGALNKVALLKPCTYKWKSDGSDGQGFIAHEINEVVPGCATGTKDAVDAEGKPVYQGIDTSFLVATLTAAIQELKALVDTQAARITALEAK